MDLGITPTSLSSMAKNVLDALAKKLESGATLTITGNARGNASLAGRRAMVVATYLESKVHVHVTLKSVTTSTVNKVRVTTR